VNANPNDPEIANEFLKWNKAGGKVMPGLTRRREAESKLYFS
jgi:lysozyme